ncbi:MAG TPA: orotate phosphoribosyltransferase [Porticoccaceae bacterium]|nr:orotate phosphoribosyltransferase [Porticoccaceae bacterium]
MLAQYQQEFIALALQRQALRFGEFTLKSGRVSPYFFNAGAFASGAAVSSLGRCYARAIVDLGIEFDILFGPAYKGIPLVTATAIALADHFQRDVPYCFNRKEAKTHGEGGVTVGSPMAGRVLIVDDVITAGTAIREALELVEQSGAEAAGIVVGLDRRERGRGSQSAIQELESSVGVSVTSVVDIEDILVYIRQNNADEALLARIERYQAEFGV